MMLRALLQDIRVAARSLARSPGFAVVATVTLALGIGAATAIFTLLHSVVIEPLPYPEPERLVSIKHPVPGLDPEWRWNVSEAGYFHFRENNRRFEDIAVYQQPTMALATDAPAEQIRTASVSANIFQLLGARPALGRLLLPSDNEPGADRVVVLGHELWLNRFGGDAGIVGRTVLMSGASVEIVGVTEPGFDLPDAQTDLWWAVTISPTNPPVNWHRFDTIGRLRPAVTEQAATADLARLVDQFSDVFPQAYGNSFMEESRFSVDVTWLRDEVVGDMAATLWILFAAVGLVLFVACANVANLFVVRAHARRGEVAIRSALGATRRNLARTYVSEGALLGTTAGLLGLLLAHGAVRLLRATAPSEVPRLDAVALGWESVAGAMGIALAAGTVFGLLPILRRRLDRLAQNEQGRGGTASVRTHAVRGALVAGQVALALVLLASAGLLVQTFRNLREVDPGLDPERVLAVSVALPFASYRDYESTARFYRELLDQIEALPGVVSAGATQALPLASGGGCALVFVDDPEAQQRNTSCFASTVQVTPGYFRTMGIRVDGRAPTWADMEAGRGEAVVTRALAERLWEHDRVLGRGIKGNGGEPPFYEIVGVASDVRGTGLDEPPVPRVYFPMLPLEGTSLWSPPRGMDVVVKTATARPENLAGSIREIVASMDPLVPIGDVRTMDRVVAQSMGRTTFATLMLAIAAGMALVLGLVGLYGVVAYTVEQRRPEIGIRMALGAAAPRISGMVLAQSARIVGVGIAIGAVAALLATRALSALLFEVSPSDPLTLATVCLLLAGVALGASWLPARRAARVDPMIALRAE